MVSLLQQGCTGSGGAEAVAAESVQESVEDAAAMLGAEKRNITMPLAGATQGQWLTLSKTQAKFEFCALPCGLMQLRSPAQQSELASKAALSLLQVGDSSSRLASPLDNFCDLLDESGKFWCEHTHRELLGSPVSSTSHYRFLSAQVGNEYCGGALIRCLTTEDRSVLIVQILAILVAPQSKGLGRLVVQTIQALAWDHAARLGIAWAVVIANPCSASVEPFYIRTGFTPCLPPMQLGEKPTSLSYLMRHLAHKLQWKNVKVNFNSTVGRKMEWWCKVTAASPQPPPTQPAPLPPKMAEKKAQLEREKAAAAEAERLAAEVARRALSLTLNP